MPIILYLHVFLSSSTGLENLGGKSLVLFLEPRAISKHITPYFVFLGCHTMSPQIKLSQSEGGTMGKDHGRSLKPQTLLSALLLRLYSLPTKGFILNSYFSGEKEAMSNTHMVVLLRLYINGPFLKAGWLR